MTRYHILVHTEKLVMQYFKHDTGKGEIFVIHKR